MSKNIPGINTILKRKKNEKKMKLSKNMFRYKMLRDLLIANKRLQHSSTFSPTVQLLPYTAVRSPFASVKKKKKKLGKEQCIFNKVTEGEISPWREKKLQILFCIDWFPYPLIHLARCVEYVSDTWGILAATSVMAD